MTAMFWRRGGNGELVEGLVLFLTRPFTLEQRTLVQVVVVATTNSAEVCHDLKSGLMERMKTMTM
jgi:hypothetical protein